MTTQAPLEAPPQGAREASEPVNVAAHLPRMARSEPHRFAVVAPEGRDRDGRVAYTHLTALQLDRSSDALARGLESVGIRRGLRTVLMVKPSLAFIELTFALFKIGAVPVLVDPGMGVKNLGTCLAEAQPEAFIGITKAHVARVALGWGKPTIKTLVTVGRRLFWKGRTLDQVRTLGAGEQPYPVVEPAPEETAAILFTSGSTGVPKGAVYAHRNFAAQVAALKRTYGITPGERDLATFPLFGLFGPALGMTTIIPDMDATRPADVDPKKIFEAIADFGVTNMFGSPALLNTVGRYGEQQGIKLSSLKRVISAGAPVPPRVLERFQALLEGEAEVVTPYGATESLPVASIGGREILSDTRHGTDSGKGVCVGRPVHGVEIRIIGTNDQPIPTWSEDLVLPTGEIGEIVVKGPMVTSSYYNRASSTELAKIAEADGAIRHRMGDLGYLDEQGRLWFCGRKSHRVQTASGVMYTVPCEAIFNTHPDVYRTALVGLGARDQAKPVLCVELEPAARGRAAQVIAQLRTLAQEHDITCAIEGFFVHPAFPVDIRHNAKIFREKLAQWAETQS
ncbi:MAG: fatty acid CoA ligase family protein [Planctomycetota bacterium]|jgi:acyl-CoA synthetase (AMP-forming)/AMP-acid ligase II